MTEIPTYFPGQTARASITFANFDPADIEEVSVFFGYEGTTQGLGVSHAELLPGTEGDNSWVAVFEIEIDADDKPGWYRCTQLEVQYKSRRVRPIEPLPEIAFRIEQTDSTIKNPEPLSEWHWHDI